MKFITPGPVHLKGLAAFGALSTACSCLAAHAAEAATYVALQGGVNNLHHWSATVDLGAGVNIPGALSLDRGAHLGLLVGRQSENARFELELQAGRFQVTSMQLGALQQTASGQGDYKALTANAYRTHPLSANMSGFAGVGLGWGSASLPQLAFANGCNCFAAASRSGLVYLGRVGLEYQLQERHHTFVQYTVLGLPSIRSGGSPGTEYGRKTVGIASIGYRYLF